MDTNRQADLSPADDLADVEVAVTDRLPDPLAPRSASASLSASEFSHLVELTAPSLSDGCVAAVFGTTSGGRRAPGATWISLTSRRGYGRLVRHSDGSSESSAYRANDGRPLVSTRHDNTTATDLDDLIAAIAAPLGAG